MPFAGAHGKVACVTFSGILTAMVTPFDADGALAEEPTARLIRHLLANGSDGARPDRDDRRGVDAQRRREGACLGHRGRSLGRERPGAPVIAGTGINGARAGGQS